MYAYLLRLMFSWLPPPLWYGVQAIMAVAFLIIMLKIIGALLSLLGKVIGLFI